MSGAGLAGETVVGGLSIAGLAVRCTRPTFEVYLEGKLGAVFDAGIRDWFVRVGAVAGRAVGSINRAAHAAGGALLAGVGQWVLKVANRAVSDAAGGCWIEIIVGTVDWLAGSATRSGCTAGSAFVCAERAFRVCQIILVSVHSRGTIHFLHASLRHSVEVPLQFSALGTIDSISSTFRLGISFI